MIHKIYIFQYVAAITGLVFALILLYTIFKGSNRDKLISVGIFSICVIAYIWCTLRINNHNAKAELFYGLHELSSYNNSGYYSIEILPNRIYKLYKNKELINSGECDLSIKGNESPMLLIDGKIFGVGEYKLKK